VRVGEHRQQLAAEQARQHIDVHEEVAARRYPARAVFRRL
jgi:hypothetical protein